METHNRVFLLSNRYQITSELAFYVRGQPTAYNINLGRRLNQYDLWGGFERLVGQDAIYVMEGARHVPDQLNLLFARVDPPHVVQVRREDRVIRTFSVFRCYDFKGLPPMPREVTY